MNISQEIYIVKDELGNEVHVTTDYDDACRVMDEKQDVSGAPFQIAVEA